MGPFKGFEIFTGRNFNFTFGNVLKFLTQSEKMTKRVRRHSQDDSILRWYARVPTGHSSKLAGGNMQALLETLVKITKQILISFLFSISPKQEIPSVHWALSAEQFWPLLSYYEILSVMNDYFRS